ncbi:transposable element Tcb1 transposase [Trichonephila clavipes]|nr:transposable element Tcb1 transposase [Trichonephila clavipes]
MNQGATNSGFQTTVQRSLLRLVLRSRRLVHAPMLTAVHQQRRLEFSHRYRNWASNERRQVEFSDQSRFILHRTDGWWQIRHGTLQQLLARFRLEAGALWSVGNVFFKFSVFIHHCGKHDGSIEVRICPFRPCLPFYAHGFSSGWWHLPAGHCGVSYN